jgi:putative toxin-antitoxin system antitoxin component (TIGR02293 family)
VALLHWSTPTERIESERRGVSGTMVKVIARSMGIASQRMYEVIGVPKATAEKKAAADEPITGAAGQAAIGMMRLLGIAKDIVENSTANEAEDFDVAKWLGRWIEIAQPALGGLKPADVLDTPTGLAMVEKLLGALESGAYL